MKNLFRFLAVISMAVVLLPAQAGAAGGEIVQPQQVVATDLDENPSGRFIVIFEAPPLAVRYSELDQDLTLTQTHREALATAYASELSSEQDQALNEMEQSGVVLKVGRRFTLLLHGFSVQVSPAGLEQVLAAPGVLAVYPEQQLEVILLDSVPLIGAPEVWALQDPSGNPVLGLGVKVGIIDTGIDYTHPDLGGCFGPACKVIGGYDFVNEDPDPMDDHRVGEGLFAAKGHGTHVAGIVAADGSVTGIAPQASLLAYKVCDSTGSCWQSDVIAALEAAVVDQADVVNLSLGGPGSPDDPMAQAVDRAVDLGVTVVAGAGNQGRYGTVLSPGLAAKALTVGATDKSDVLTSFTSMGPVSDYWIKPDLVAPGLSIYSTVLDHEYAFMSGTSMSSPHGAGAAALLKQLHPDWSPAMVKAALMNAALPLGNVPFAEGAGRLQVGEAARSTFLVQPGSLSLGRIDKSQRYWTSSGSFEISNLAGEGRVYQLAVEGDLPAGIFTRLSQREIWIGPGHIAAVTLTLRVDHQAAPYPEFPYFYHGRVVVTGQSVQRRVPFAFVPAPITCEEQAQVPVAECNALVALYNNTNGPNWNLRSGWLDLPPCDWVGVYCDGGHVIALSLDDNGLKGNLPADLGDLQELGFLSAGQNQLSGSIPAELAMLPKLGGLVLFSNRLTGSIPSAWGNLPGMVELYLDSNALSGDIPATMTSLAGADFGFDYNMLTASDPALVAFLEEWDPDWDETQTVPPANVQVVSQSTNSVELAWTPIDYTGDGGYYEVSYAASPGGPYTVHGVTADKFASGYPAGNLAPKTNYYFVVRSFTPSHPVGEFSFMYQQNDLWSAYSPEVPASTLPAVLTVPIDIRPRVATNRINRNSSGLVQVAVLSTRTWDAPGQIRWGLLTFGHTGDEPSLNSLSNGDPDCWRRDVSGDGRADLVCRFRISQAGFLCGDKAGILKGVLLSGVNIKGRDSVVVLPCP